MQIIQAPKDYTIKQGEIPCFMAGGLQKCGWHEEFLLSLQHHSCDRLVVYNPKRSTFDMSNPNLALEQIAWEFKYLNKYLDQPWIFSMYFDGSDSVQPICFYELGRYVSLLDFRGKHDQIVVSIHPNFSRAQDVQVQTVLATSARVNPSFRTPEQHAREVARVYKDIIGEKE